MTYRGAVWHSLGLDLISFVSPCSIFVVHVLGTVRRFIRLIRTTTTSLFDVASVCAGRSVSTAGPGPI